MTREGAVKLDGVEGIDNIVKVLQEYQARGESVYVQINDKKLYSADITLDGAYKELTGRTKTEFDKAAKEAREKFKKELDEEKEQAEKSIPSWIERGEKLVPESKKEAWGEYVKSSVNGLYGGLGVKDALDIMEKIVSGASQEEIEKLVSEQCNSGASYGLVRKVVKEFLGQDIENIRSTEKKSQNLVNDGAEEKDYQITSKDIALTVKERVGAKMIRKIKELFSKIMHHDNNMGGR